MATDVGLPQLSARLAAIQGLLRGDFTTIGHAVGKGARLETIAVAQSVSGGDAVLSHFGRKGAKLGMGYDLEEQGRRVIVKLRPPGVWIIVERGARAHSMPKRARRRGGDRYLFGSGYQHPVRGPIGHPGARGKGAITRAFGRVRGRASRDAHNAWIDELAKVMGA